jgi:ATP-dependent Clp protease protease subunit
MNQFEKEFGFVCRDNGVSQSTIKKYSNHLDQYLNPTIIEERKLNVASMDVFSRLMMDRILFLQGGIDSDVANIINSQLLFLQMDNPGKPVTIYINSPGGSVYDGMAIYDVMNLISCPVYTTCCGTAASMAAVLLSSGEKGFRNSLPHSQIMLHAPSSGGQGHTTAPDFRIAAAEMEKCENMLYKVLAENMDKDFDYVKKICDRDYWLTPEEAVSQGVIDEILKKK